MFISGQDEDFDPITDRPSVGLLSEEPGAKISEVGQSYYDYSLSIRKELPPITWKNLLWNLDWLNVFILSGVPAMTVLGCLVAPLRWETFWFSVFYYYVTGLGITAGYHRLWSHRSYNAGPLLEWFLAFAGAGAVEGSAHWWARGHRAHHRYTDTKLDPYNAKEGFLYAHLGWMLLKPRRKIGTADISDLRKNSIVQFQHKYYLVFLPLAAFVFPTVVPWVFWNDPIGGFFYAGFARLMFVHHSTFCINSLAHMFGTQPYDYIKTPRNHLFTAMVTIGEGYHNYHHQYPTDYRVGTAWHHYDPTKWFIWTCKQIGLASHLKEFPENEVKKGQLMMQLRQLRDFQSEIEWPKTSEDLPVVSWDAYVEQAKERPLILIGGFIHDVSTFFDYHPGGVGYLKKYIGKDATTAFFGGIYEHSNGAHNLCAMRRVGVLHGGVPHAMEEKVIPPGQLLQVAAAEELKKPVV
ncbi:Delta-9 fatty acid desaturase protein [Mycena chlorophos]|nr:Delta-9 fatty acid desaturase protein [Mycena chlorophos]